MMSYLNNINSNKNDLRGILLYPKPYDMDSIKKTYNTAVTSNGQIKPAKLQFITIDLSDNWKIIRDNLLDLVQ